ncbi:MAG: hypothetical protein Q8902_02330 [Bacteroidota bacterium]|nr:hypothetical protein [Bacteroidota bacterium]MDP4231796.1 hypothetical protein [Bacteroidota bacterium]
MTLPHRARLGLSISLIAGLAGFFRFYRLHTLPLGLYHDEGMNGNDALIALRTGVWHVFYPDNNGREGLFINLQAISIRLFGATPFALRAVSAMMGVLAAIGLFMLVRDFFDVRGHGEPGRSALFSRWPRYALVAGTIHAVLIWPVITSRLGLRAQMSSAAIVWVLWAFLRLYNCNWVHTRTSRFMWSALAGVFLGIGLNSYIAFRAAPAIVIGVIVLAVLARRKYVWGSTAVIACFAAALTAPLMVYFLQHPSMASGHIEQVSVFGQHKVLLGIGYNLWMELQMCFWRGDMNWRHNFGGAPMIPWLLQPFFVVGILLMLRRILTQRNNLHGFWREAVMVLWFVFGSLPNVLAESHTQPHGLRLLLIAPAITLVVAFGMVRTFDWLSARLAIPRAWTNGILAIVLIVLTGYEYNLLFHQYTDRAEMHTAYSYRQYDLAKSLEEHSSSKRRYVLSPFGDTTAHGIPILAQGIAYLTQTLTPEEQAAKNIHYAIAGSVPASDSVELIPIPW